MKKYSDSQLKEIRKFSQFSNVVNFDVADPVLSDFVPEDNQLLDVIYAPDPETGLPKGDISLFMSDRTSPEIRAFISQSIHSDLPDSPRVPDGVDVTRYMREKGEDRNQYLSRLQKTLQEDIAKEKLSKKLEK